MRKRRAPIYLWSALMTAATFTSCGQHDSSRTSGGDSSDADAGVTISDSVTPPKEYYDALLADRMNASDLGLVTGTQVLYVNFNGARVGKGYSRGKSFIPCASEAKIPPSGLSSADQEVIMKKVAESFSNAQTKVELTYTEPTSGDYTTMHVGGKYADLGCVGGGSVLGIAPFDVDNANPNDTGFVFIPKSKNLTTIADTISHEAGHSFGLDHTNNQIDLMYPTLTSKVIGFDKGIAEGSRRMQDGPAYLQLTLGSGVASVTGTQVQPTNPSVPAPAPSPSPAPSIPNFPTIPGLPNINNIPGLNNLGNLSQLLGQLSPDLVNILSGKIPQIGNLPGGIVLQNPTSMLSLITLLQNAVTKQNGGQFDMSQLTNLISNPQFSQLGTILAMVGMSGLNPSAGIGGILPMILPMITNGGATPANSVPVDLAALLNLSSIQNPGQLIALIPQYSQLINANYSGGQSQALMDLVKLAISAQYNQIQ